MSYPTSKVTDNIAIRYPAPSPGLYHIGLLHANVDGDPQHETYAPCTKRSWFRPDSTTGRWGISTPAALCRNLLISCTRAISRDAMSGRRARRDVTSLMWTAASTRSSASMSSIRCDGTSLKRLSMLAGTSTNGDAPGVHPHRNSQSERGSAKHDPRSDYGRSPVHRQLEGGHILDELLTDLRRREAAKGKTCGYLGCVWIESFASIRGCDRYGEAAGGRQLYGRLASPCPEGAGTNS